MSDKELEDFLSFRQTDCPICGDPLADHALWELGNCEHRKQMNAIFIIANRGRPIPETA